MEVKKRHAKIIELIKNHVIETQEELANTLSGAGFEVTQATVSRDIRDLKLTKISIGDGRQRYAVLPAVDHQVTEKLTRVFRDGVLSIDYAGHMVVLKTLEGLAMAVGASVDAMGLTEVIASVAGDNAVICVVKSEEIAAALMKKLNAALKDGLHD
ncbi:MAG: arginine repressor [Clostridiales bacterium]|jgi:transcriptional regulator of arginine metabolism|nr:arginine repressor [Clostridiales bacterium]